jgi:cytochrome b involved in lipid metabolism
MRLLWLRVVRFLHTLPGGAILTLCIGKDATEAFEDVGHSDEAREILKGLYVGEFEGAPVCQAPSMLNAYLTSPP